MNTNGIDISYANGSVAWDKVTADFVMIKASQGYSLNGVYHNFTDKLFAVNAAGAIKRGIKYGTYHYLTAKTVAEARAEADYYISVIKPYKPMWAAVDVEEDKYLPTDKAALTAIVAAFCERVKTGGYTPMVYTNPNYLKYRLNDISAYPLWLALWRDKSNVPTGYKNLKIWQYGGGRADGVNGTCDLNLGIEVAVDYAAAVCAKCGLEGQTRKYMDGYKYADALWRKIYNALSKS